MSVGGTTNTYGGRINEKRRFRQTTAGLTSYAISRGATPDHIDDLSFSDHDMTEQGWVKVGTADITVTLTDHDEYVAAQVSTLRAAKARIQAEAEAQATRIEGMIQNLLALPAPTERARAIVEAAPCNY